MTGDRDAQRRLAASLPDIPRWLETRGMLLAGEAEVTGLREDGPHFVARDTVTGLVSVVGRPDAAAVRQAVEASPDSAEPLLAPGDSAEYVASLLPGWRREAAVLHLLASSASLPKFLVSEVGGMLAWPYVDVDPEDLRPESMPDDVAMRFISTAELAAVTGIPDMLRRELTIAVLRRRLAATFLNGAAVSFCYAGYVTETLWDVSIDTLEAFRRHGYAGLCVAYVIDQMNRERKRPVWGAVESNEPSLRLASKLGFRPVDRITVFRCPRSS
jgi:GNAT superfamily N-acetyltransferase